MNHATRHGRQFARHLCAVAVIVALVFTAPVMAEGGSPWLGRSLHSILDDAARSGMPLFYSTGVVAPTLKVTVEPRSEKLTERLVEVLTPHRLVLQEASGHYFVVRAPRNASPESTSLLVIIDNYSALEGQEIRFSTQPVPADVQDISPGIYQLGGLSPGTTRVTAKAPGFLPVERSVTLQNPGQTGLLKLRLVPGIAELEPLAVAASRYVLFSNSQFFIDQRALQALPDLGEDPLRSVHRLPGTAAGGLSSRSHFRGGEHDETAIYLNGLKLVDPFHIRDYHSIFSSIDARAISGVEAYTGGFPAPFGDQMSGVLLMETRSPEEPVHSELGLSIYNTSVLNSGYAADGRVDWLFSARDSNLDLVLSDDLGEPDYFDVFATVGWQTNDRHRLSFNLLYAKDQVSVITESDPEELEQSVSNTDNRHLWLKMDSQWTPALRSSSVLAWSRLDNLRVADVNDPERLVAELTDRREADILSFRQDWHYDRFADHSLRWGFELQRLDAAYDYRSRAEYLEFFEAWPGIESPEFSEIRVAPQGSAYSAYLSDRWRLTARTAIEAGLRWDEQTYTEPRFDAQLSPRLSLLYQPGPRTDWRLTWGRYSQSQAIQSLQVEDGLSHFQPPQRADHWIVGLKHRLGARHRLRVELFLKDYQRPRTRFENLYDPLALIPELSPDRIRLDPESARARGVEVSWQYFGDDDLDAWASYTLSRVADRIGGESQPRSWDQRHAVQAGLAWRPGAWEVGLALSVHSGWPTTALALGVDEAEDGEEEYFPIPGPRNREQLGTYAQLDFRVSRTFETGKGQLSLFFEVTNATNRKNECCIDFDIEEDDEGNVFLDRSVEYWLPVIPAVGLSWVF